MGQSPFLESIRRAIRTRHHAHSTEKAYVGRVLQFILFNGKRHPLDLGAKELESFLSILATRRKVSATVTSATVG